MSHKFLVNILTLYLLHETVIKHHSVNNLPYFHTLISWAQKNRPFAKIFYLIPRLMQWKTKECKYFNKCFYDMQNRLVSKRRLLLSEHCKCDWVWYFQDFLKVFFIGVLVVMHNWINNVDKTHESFLNDWRLLLFNVEDRKPYLKDYWFQSQCSNFKNSFVIEVFLVLYEILEKFNVDTFDSILLYLLVNL